MSIARRISLRRLVRRLFERAAHEALAGLPLHRRPRENAALVVGLHVVQAGRGIERRRVPVRRAFERRAHAFAFERRLHVGHDDRPAFGREAAGPGHVLRVLLAEQELAVGAIEHVEESVAVGLHQELARPALPGGIDQRRRLLRVVVPDIVRRELKVPLQLSGFRIQRDDRIRIEVVAAAIVANQIGRRIAGRPVQRVELRIVGAGQPRGRARMLDALSLPGLGLRLAGRGTVQKRQASLPVA